jgi:hypothetical protein
MVVAGSKYYNKSIEKKKDRRSEKYRRAVVR